VYDRIGGQYRHGRQEDPRIAARIWPPLRRVSSGLPWIEINAGAGILIGGKDAKGFDPAGT